jgi:nickel-dependent lactate racemase
MSEIIQYPMEQGGIKDQQLAEAISQSIQEKKSQLKKVLLIPPDFTRMHSGAGKITNLYYNLLKDSCHIDIMPALGTHDPMSEEECCEFFGEDIPMSCIIPHKWREDIVKIGEIPSDFVKEVSEGLIDYSIEVEVNKRLMDKAYDLIISIGQVVPHEVVGMANYSKNIFVGCGGKSIINKSHFLGAVCGMEKVMGKDFSPVRKVFDYAEEKFLSNLPIMYVLTVTTVEKGNVSIEGLFIGRSRKLFEMGVELSKKKNLTYLPKSLKKVVVFLDEKEFKSTWIGNKSIYRTRMAIADGGELIVLAPGIKKFGEDEAIDKLIRKYGYKGRDKTLDSYKQNEDLKDNLSAAAHLIHGSSDGRFKVTYAVKNVTQNEVESVGYEYMEYTEASRIYNPDILKDGFNTLENGEEIFFISNPAIGLWVSNT